MTSKPTTLLVLVLIGLLSGIPTLADDKDDKRASLDAMAEQTLERLFENRRGTEALYDEAYGYAVFSNLKVAFIVSGGGGAGVAVEKSTGDRTYMKMGTGGIGLGLGGQKYRVVFLFENEERYRAFVDNGWQADAGAKAAAGTEGVNAKVGFKNGIAIYQLTEAGLIAAADIAGTRYWRHKKLN